MSTGRLIFVTGKGGVGKTTVSAALGQQAAALGERTLIIETAGDGSLAQLFGRPQLGPEPHRLAGNLYALRVNPRELVEQYFARLLRFSILSNRLFASGTFNALTAAAPGITEFLLLEQLLGWIEPAFGRRGYGVIIVDGPASGHALRLLRTPRTLATMVAGGPLGRTARHLLAVLADHQRTRIVIVSLPEEMAVRETIETHRILHDELALHVVRPVVNRVYPRRFTGADIQQIERNGALEPLVAAARFAIACRREAERHVAHLRRTLGVAPVLLRQQFTPTLHAGDLGAFGATLGKAVLESSDADD